MRGMGVVKLVAGCAIMMCASFSIGEVLSDKHQRELSQTNSERSSERLAATTERTNESSGTPQIFSLAQADSGAGNAQLAKNEKQDQSIPIMLVYVLGALVLSLITLSKDRRVPESEPQDQSR